MADILFQVWQSLTRRKITMVLAILSLGIGVAAFLCLSAFMQVYLRNMGMMIGAESFSGKKGIQPVDINIKLASHRGGTRFDPIWIFSQMRRVFGSQVGVISNRKFPVKIGRYVIDDAEVTVITSNMQGNSTFSPYNPKIIGSGRRFSTKDDVSKDPICIIDLHLAEAFQGENPVGKTLRIAGYPFRIIAVGDKGNDLGSGSILISFAGAQALLRTQFSTEMPFTIWAHEQEISTDLERYSRKISNVLGPNYQVAKVDCEWLDHERDRAILGYANFYLTFICLLPLIIGLVAMVSMLLANLNSRIHEIGLYRALGATRARLALLMLVEASSIGFFASLIGIPIGVLVLKGLTDLWGGELFLPQACAGVAILAGTITSLLAGLIPARAAMRISPAESLRAE
jgi:ABC-type antimicrobial peptide transport system permease subunit